MDLDTYAECPGGTGKKIRFCCKDLVGDLEKVTKMLRGSQYKAGARQIDGLLEKHPDRACLWALKCAAFRMMGDLKQATATAEQFLEKHPDNPVALSEAAVAAVHKRQLRRAVDLAVRAWEQSGEEVASQVLWAIGSVAEGCIAARLHQTAHALLALLASVVPRHPVVVDRLAQLIRLTDYPLLLKGDAGPHSCPEDVPWKAQFDQALELLRRSHWRQAAAEFARLAEQVPDAPAIWKNLALCRAFLVDTEGAIEALDRYASLDVPLEEAAEAVAQARLLTDDPLGDRCDVFSLSYEVHDVERLQAALISSRRALPAQVTVRGSDDQPPPKAVFFILDRDKLVSAEGASSENTPRLQCIALLFGRQTDCPAMLRVSPVDAEWLEDLKGLFRQVADGAMAAEPHVSLMGTHSRTGRLLSQEWALPRDKSAGELKRIKQEGLDKTMLEIWPDRPLGLLDGKTPRQAAAEPQYRVRVLAAILILEHLLVVHDQRFDLDRLRTALGLPVPTAIDPATTRVDSLPLARLSRVDISKLGPYAL
ncbi:MAG TPA: hypothetical protein EYP56_04815, partial [Planctomycetaceae bacterium]|nr:hypothetical protein [Planctomycetaceae bacterium]